MALRLNKLDDAKIADFLDKDVLRWMRLMPERLPKIDPANTEELYDYHRQFSDNSYYAGASYYQQERPLSEARLYLRQAGDSLLIAYEYLGPPKPNSVRLCEWFEKLLNLVICFGDKQNRVEAAKFSKECYYHFSTSEAYDQNEPKALGVIEYCEILKKLAAGQAIDSTGFRHCRELCEDPKATKVERVDTLLKLQALDAASKQDGDSWNANIAEIVKNHKHESMRGQLKHSDDAFICLPALALAKLGTERGLICTIKSDYLPLQLLGDNR